MWTEPEVTSLREGDLHKLPPTKDAVNLHLSRCNHQSQIWLQAGVGIQTLQLSLQTGGWKHHDTTFENKWTTLLSVPVACVQLVSRCCKTKFKTAASKYNKSGQKCTPVCECNAEDCCNPAGLTSDDI